MIDVWRSLLWKEWREHRGKLVALATIFAFVPMFLAFVGPPTADGVHAAITFTFAICVPLGSLFVGMHAASGEQSRGTIRFLQALPTPLAKPAAAKLIVAAFTVVTPIVVAVIFAGIWKLLVFGDDSPAFAEASHEFFGSPWGVSTWYAATILAGALASLSLLLWMAAPAVNSADEVRAGAIGLIVILTCWAALLLALFWSGLERPWHRVLFAALPAGAAVVQAQGGQGFVASGYWNWLANFWPYLAAALLSHGVLAAVYLKRFGRISARRRQTVESTPSVSPAPKWLAPPRRSPLTATLWKQVRESAPLAAMGAAVIVFGGVWAAVANRDAELFAQTLAEIIATIWFTVGCFVAIAAGIGLFMEDMRPGIHAFWRSRPIRVNQWFAVKFTLGLFVTLALLAAAPAVVAASMKLLRQGNRLAIEEQTQILLEVGLPVQTALFAVAAAMMVLVRQALYAAVLTIGLCLAAFALTAGGAPEWLAERLVIGTGVVLSVAGILTAWLALRNDWGWNS